MGAVFVACAGVFLAQAPDLRGVGGTLGLLSAMVFSKATDEHPVVYWIAGVGLVVAAAMLWFGFQKHD